MDKQVAEVLGPESGIWLHTQEERGVLLLQIYGSSLSVPVR